MNLTEDDIVHIEEFVQKELEQRMLDRCLRLGTHLDAIEMESFFGIYAGSITEFKFLRGERIQILGLAESLRAKFAELGKERFSKHFEVPTNFKFDKNGTHDFSFGLFYGLKPRKRVAKMVLNADQMKAQLFFKVQSFYQSFELIKNREFTEKMIQIVDLGTSVRADVKCIFCKKADNKHAIQFDKTSGWNLSNFRKHVKNHQKKTKNEKEEPDQNRLESQFGEQSTTNSNMTQLVPKTTETRNEPKQMIDIMDMPIVLEEYGIHFEQDNRSLTSLMYEQFSTQNLKLIEATMVNNEPKKFMVLIIENRRFTVNVSQIDPDGNCLFAAVTHQLEYAKIKSKSHIDRTAAVRKQVVNHIEAHFDAYKHVIQLRLNCEEKEIAKLGKEFLTDVLSANGTWGASESLLAMVEIFGINILVFNENGPFYFSSGFKPENKRCIFLAYRERFNEKGEKEYYHYDSVCEIETELLFKCAFDLGGKMGTKNMTDSSVIEI